MSLVSVQQTIKNGDVEEVKNLLDSGRLSVNEIVCPEDNIPALSYVLLFGREEKVAHLLLTRKADVHQLGADRWTPLHYASRFGKATVVERLLELRSDVNATTTQSRRSPLQLALYGNLKQRDVVEMLILAGAKLESIPDDHLYRSQRHNNSSWQSLEKTLKWSSR